MFVSYEQKLTKIYGYIHLQQANKLGIHLSEQKSLSGPSLDSKDQIFYEFEIPQKFPCRINKSV